ncbi:MAG: hypothetical protein IH909_01540 [Proteobacteria bacterium]|nr:hypothetical protein [Pseudomonadota bacterium]
MKKLNLSTNGQYIKEFEPHVRKAKYDFCPIIYGKALIGPIGNLVANRIRTDNVEDQIASMVNILQRPVILLAHSNGAMLSWMVSNHCDNVVGVISFNGALDRDTKFENCWVINCYHPGDWVLKVFARYRILSKWGDYGARRNEGAVVQINLKNYYDGWNPHSLIMKHLDIVMPRVMSVVDSILERKDKNAKRT